MSTLKVDAIRHNSATSDAITTVADGTCTAKLTSVGGSGLSHRNKVINGGMVINQRASSYTSTGAEYTIDRFAHAIGSAFTFDTTTTQDSSTPDGFVKSLKITPDSTQTPTGSHNGVIRQVFEGQDFQDLAFGTSSAKSVTLSFYAKSASQNNGHQYGVQLRCRDGSTTQYVNQAFTVTSSWQRFTMTFVGNTGSVIRNDNQTGFEICFHLASGPDDIVSAKSTWTLSSAFQTVTGQSNFMDNTSNEFYLTGVQLEVGDTATSFEHRSFGEELRRCERYFEKHWQNNNSASPGGAAGDGYNTVANGTHNGSNGYYVWRWRTQKRALPTISHGGKFRIFGASSHSNQTVNEFYSPGLDAGRLRVNHSGSAGQSFILEFDGANSSDGYIQADAEL